MSEWQWWTDALNGVIGPMHEGEPQTGYYKVRRKGKDGFVPVAYWKDTGTGAQRCHMDGEDFDEQRAVEIWPYASKNPVTQEAYSEKLRSGKWPGESDAVIRDNSAAAPDDDTYEALKDRIDDLAREADRVIDKGAAKDQAQADQASDLANRLGELHKRADTARAAEKKPYDDEAKAVQAKWLPVLGAAEVYKRLKAAVITPFLVAEEQKRRAAEAEARKAAEEAAKAGAPIPEPVAAKPAPKAGSGGRRSVALRSVKVVTITDRAALLKFFEGNEQITDLLQTLAQRAVAAGVSVPGVSVTEEQRAA